MRNRRRITGLSGETHDVTVMPWDEEKTMLRTPPPRTPTQQKEHERLQALASLDIPAMRAWAAQYAVGLLGDDRTVLISMHETRLTDPAMPPQLCRESRAWLEQEYAESAVLIRAQALPGQFTGPASGRAKR